MTAAPATMDIRAVAAVGPWGGELADLAAAIERGGLPSGASTPVLPLVPGFVESPFNSLLYDVAKRCLTAAPGDGARTALVVASVMGDTGTTDLASQRLVAGQTQNPLLFMQATPNAVLGYLSREFQLTGPLTAIGVRARLAGELLDLAEVLLDDPELDRVLAIGVELVPNHRARACYELLAGAAPPPDADAAVALLLTRPATAPADAPTDAPATTPAARISVRGASAPATGHHALPADGVGIGAVGSVAGLSWLAVAYAHRSRLGPGTTFVHDLTAPPDRAWLSVRYHPSADDRESPR